jgi:hypothetical protein
VRLRIRRGTEQHLIVIVAGALPDGAAMKRRDNIERAKAHRHASK